MAKQIAITLLLAVAAGAQTSEEGIRQLWTTQIQTKRPAPKAGSTKKQAAKPVVYKSVAQIAAPAQTKVAGLTDTLIGLTLWVLRPPRAADSPGSRLLIIEEDNAPPSEFVPERVEADAPVTENARVRLTVEVPRTGYLYVIDREQYADGGVSAPYLIYPNFKTRPGDNAVAAGRLVEVPDQRDNPNHFKVRRSRPDQVGELLTMLVTPEPLDLKIGRQPLKLSDEQFTKWEKDYSAKAERFELSGGAGTAYTESEKKAGSGPDALLTQDDPPPQTLYKVTCEPDKPIMLSLPVKIK